MKDPSKREPIIRLACEGDSSGIVEIYNHYVSLGGATFDAVPWTDEQMIDLMQAEHPETWLVSIADGRILGWASARQFSSRHGYRHSLESAIYLSPDAVGRGVADPLQRAIESTSREKNVHHLMARIVAGNQRSMAFHYRHGYTLVGIQNEVGYMDDTWVDVAILQKLLR